MLCAYCGYKIHAKVDFCRYCHKPCHVKHLALHEADDCRPKWDKDHITDFVKEELE
jgi:hypothetical protein